MHKEDVSTTTCAFIAGATVGAGIALLFAPQAGPELRRQCATLHGEPKTDGLRRASARRVGWILFSNVAKNGYSAHCRSE